MEGRRIGASAGQPADSGDRQRRHLELDDRGRGHVAERHPQRVIGSDLVVAEGPDDQRREAGHTTGDDHEEIERCLVRPVQVVEHDDRRRGARTANEREECFVDRVPVTIGQRPAQVATDPVGDVHDRGERTRRIERVARAPIRAHARRRVRAERLGQRRLADACLADEERHAPPPSTRLREQPRELVQQRLPLEQRHRRIVKEVRLYERDVARSRPASMPSRMSSISQRFDASRAWPRSGRGPL